jgi:hypothetical protein
LVSGGGQQRVEEALRGCRGRGQQRGGDGARVIGIDRGIQQQITNKGGCVYGGCRFANKLMLMQVAGS